MSPSTDLKNDPQTQTPTVPSISAGETDWNNNVRIVIILSSFAIIGAFFLPWIQVFLSKPSGYDLVQLPSEELKLLWCIPLMAGISLFAAFMRNSIKLAAIFAGFMPILALLYYASEIGQGFFDALQIGAYITLVCAVILLLSPNLLKQPNPKP